MLQPDEEKWKKVEDKELEMLKSMGVYVDEKLPEGRKVIGNHWVFEFKLDVDVRPPIHKARLVAQGFSQIPFINYDATFVPVTKSASVHFVAVHATLHGWHLECFDMTWAFLCGDLTCTIYMHYPPGYTSPKGLRGIWRLLKSLYGLKRASLFWYKLFQKVLESLGFLCSEFDHTLGLPTDIWVANRHPYSHWQPHSFLPTSGGLTLVPSNLFSSRHILHCPSSVATLFLSRDFAAAKQVLHYLKGTCSYCLSYRGENRHLPLSGLSDVDWAGNKKNRASISPLIVSTDNNDARFLSINDSNHGKAKHINIRYHFIRSHIESNSFIVKHTPGVENTVDIFTKPLSRIIFQSHIAHLGLSACWESVLAFIFYYMITRLHHLSLFVYHMFLFVCMDFFLSDCCDGIMSKENLKIL